MGKARVVTYTDLLEASVESKFKDGEFVTLSAGSRAGFGMKVAECSGFQLVIVKSDGISSLGGTKLRTETMSNLSRDMDLPYRVGRVLGFDVEMSAEDRVEAYLRAEAEAEKAEALKRSLKKALMGWLVDAGKKSEYKLEIIQAKSSFFTGLESTEELMARLNNREALATWFVENPPKAKKSTPKAAKAKVTKS